MNQNEGHHNKLQKLYETQKVALYVLLGLIYSGFLGTQLGRIQAISDFNYTLHELLFVPATLALYLGPVMFLVYFYLLIKYIKKRERGHWGIKSAAKTISVIASIVAILIIMNHQSHEVSTAGIFVLEQKHLVEGKYYLVIDERQIKVSRNEYQLAEVENEYLVSFIWNSRSKKGILETIEPVK
ncbi:hypothetical protein ABE41_018900 [Fictibacillus arsenicus]|uniref:Uncharacterized protein n=2 Tax=Fictibacillus arsenicus TaxID=255247 RepID=A0A1B1Z9G6_9BACL|nr:hypothetical protein ABE41_018900 [Fictibacillus arsenicus]